MKFSVQQLAKYNREPFSLEGEFDFSNRLKPDDDLRKISTVKIKGFGQEISLNTYRLTFTISCVFTLEDAVTLEDVLYPLSAEINEVVSFELTNDDSIIYLENNTLDIDEIVWQYCYLSRPMSYSAHEFKEE